MTAPGPENDKAGEKSLVEAAAADPVPAVDAQIQGLLGRKLRENYEEVVKEDVPDRFLQLLDELKRKEKTSKKDGGS
jgi:hypothetical protein